MVATFNKFVGFRRLTILTFYVFSSVIFCCFGTDALGQSGTYQVQPEDNLKISFWGDPELNSVSRVDKDGGIELPLIGRITAAGLTLNVLREKIISQMALYNKLVNQVSISVTEYGGNIVFVTGQVKNPGKFSFEKIPNLWDLLLEAGGPLENASLDQVVIVRNQEQGKIYTVNLLEALQEGKLDELAKIYPGDMIQVSGTASAFSPLVQRDEIYIFGAVRRQGALRFVPGSDILQLIGKAGGYTKNADLKKVKHVSVSNGTTTIAIINLDEYLDKTIPTPMPVGAGDYIIIPSKRSFFISKTAKTVLSLSITIATVYYVRRAIR